MNKLDDVLKLLPISLQYDEVVVAMFEAAVLQLQEAYEEAHELADFTIIDRLPEDMLDLIAYEKHVDFYDLGLSIEQKRSLIKSNISWHRKKGTRWALEHVVSIVMPQSEVQEWFEYEGRPYYFRLYTKKALSPNTNFGQITKAVNQYKNLRSWLENITVQREMGLGLNIGGAYPLYQRTTIKPPSITIPDLQATVSFGFATASYQKTIIEVPQMTMPNFDFVRTFGGAFSIYAKTVIKQEGVV